MLTFFRLMIFIMAPALLIGQGKELYQGQELPYMEKLERISFGSCNNQEKPQHIWKAIAATEPDLWIWMGDNIYGDTEDMELMEKKYIKQKYNEYYTAFRGKTPIIGIWDDHDYGVNDGDKMYSPKKDSKELMFDFLDVPKKATSRKRPGAFQYYTFGEEGRRVRVILLDCRSFRDGLKKDTSGKARYVANPSGDVLGEQQWRWLEFLLKKDDVQLNIIISGIQIIPEEQVYEKWANFPAARKRFFDLLKRVKPVNTLLMSGDRHIAEISRMDLEELDYPLYEITSSGMTHTWSKGMETEPNAFRVSPLIINKNFGSLVIDWEAENLSLVSRIHSDEGEVLFEKEMVFIKE